MDEPKYEVDFFNIIIFIFLFFLIDHDNGKSYIQFFGEGGGCGLIGNCLGIYLSVQETTETCTRQPTLGQAQDEVSITRPRVSRMQDGARWHAPGLCLATAVSEETRACLACQIAEYHTSTSAICQARARAQCWTSLSRRVPQKKPDRRRTNQDSAMLYYAFSWEHLELSRVTAEKLDCTWD